MNIEWELERENAILAARCQVLAEAVNTALGWIGVEQPDAHRVAEAREALRDAWKRVHIAELRAVMQ